MNERLKTIRKHFKLSQEEFGKRIGLTKQAISKLENGENAITESNIILICREYGINFTWLKDGIGDMESDFKTSILDDLVEEYNLDEVDRQIVENYMRLDQASKKVLKDYLKSLTILWEEK